jgi:pimeloyl-ACP methyl ester carboxylesterase
MEFHDLAHAGESLRVAEAGPRGGASVFFFHSLGTSWELYAAQSAALQDKYHLVAMDCRGHGGSTNRGGFTISACVDDAMAAIEQLRIARVHLVGLSMGGLMAAELAARLRASANALGTRCESLVMACSYAFAGGGPGAQERIEATRQMLATKGMAAFGRMYMESTACEFMPKAVRDRLAEVIGGMKPDDYIQTLQSILTHDATQALQQLRDLPVLVLTGALDQRVTPEVLQHLLSAVPQAQRVELARAGHLASAEDAEGFTRALTDFLPADSALVSR